MSIIYSDNISFIFFMIVSSIIYHCFICYYINYKEQKQLNLIEDILTMQDKTDTSLSVTKIQLRDDLDNYKLELRNFIDDLFVSINDRYALKEDLVDESVKLESISDEINQIKSKYIRVEDLISCIICYIGASRGMRFTLNDFILNAPRDYLITEKI